MTTNSSRLPLNSLFIIPNVSTMFHGTCSFLLKHSKTLKCVRVWDQLITNRQKMEKSGLHRQCDTTLYHSVIWTSQNKTFSKSMNNSCWKYTHRLLQLLAADTVHINMTSNTWKDYCEEKNGRDTDDCIAYFCFFCYDIL